MTLLVLSFIAGLLTVAAPCILPLLPVIIGGSLTPENGRKKTANYRPLFIAGSLVVSVVVFTLLLKATTSLLGVSDMVWQIISGVIVTLLGVHFIWPKLWERLPIAAKFNISASKLLGSSFSNKGLAQPILIGISLGPVFNSCSPTYALIVAGILPTSFATGFAYLIAYAIGMAGTLLIVSYAGQAAVSKMGWLEDPNGAFRRIIGGLFIIVGLAVIFGFDKDIQTFVLERGWYDPIGNFEESLR